MLFVPSAASDIKKYYQGTYVKFRDTGDTLCLIKRVDNEKITGFTSKTDETGQPQEFVLYLHEDTPYEVDYVLPHKSYFQYGKNACQLFRIPARQYQRGLNDQNTRIAVLKPDGSFGTGSIDFPMLTAYVEKKAFSTLTEAVANKEKHNSVALSPRFAYVPKIATIYLDSKRIGKVDSKAGTIQCFYPVFQNELASLDKAFKVI